MRINSISDVLVTNNQNSTVKINLYVFHFTIGY